jgi:uncharacterized protein (DUF885 family)
MTHIKTAVLFGAAALCCVPCLARAQSADERLRAVYTEEWKWRLGQFPGLEGVEKPVPDRLPKADLATQEMRLRYWQDVLHKLDDVPRGQLSPEEQLNYDVYRPEIENSSPIRNSVTTKCRPTRILLSGPMWATRRDDLSRR